MAQITYLEAIRQALWEELEQDERVLLLGQDIGTYGGAFRVTAAIDEELNTEVDRALASPMPPPERAFENVYAEGVV